MLDNDENVFFHNKDFNILSNFSAFQIELIYKFTIGSENSDSLNLLFQTSENLYQFFKFSKTNPNIGLLIKNAKSAHLAFELAQKYKEFKNPNWDKIKNDVMRYIVFIKTEQHEYVFEKLLSTGNRELIENSWIDDCSNCSKDQNDQNQLGKIWMELRSFINKNPDDWFNRNFEFVQKKLLFELFENVYIEE